MNSTQHKIWINVAKAIAIIAVLVNHTIRILYENAHIESASYFSVSVFIVLSGMTMYISRNNKEHMKASSYVLYRLRPIIVSYLVATFLYVGIKGHCFDLQQYIKSVLAFDACHSFYFLVFFIQLIIIAPILYKLVTMAELRHGWLYQLIILVVLLIFSYGSITFTYILPVHGGGQYLLGATYVLFFYLGMLIEHYSCEISNFILKKRFLSLICASVLLVFSYLFLDIGQLSLDSHLPFGEGINPPSVSLFFYGFSVIFFIFILCNILQEKKVGKKILNIFGMIGKYSLYIFLYHRLIIDYLLLRIPFNNMWIKWTVYFICMIVLPIVIKKMEIYSLTLWKKLSNNSNG